MCRGSMLSVLERASSQPSSDTNGRFSFPRPAPYTRPLSFSRTYTRSLSLCLSRARLSDRNSRPESHGSPTTAERRTVTVGALVSLVVFPGVCVAYGAVGCRAVLYTVHCVVRACVRTLHIGSFLSVIHRTGNCDKVLADYRRGRARSRVSLSASVQPSTARDPRGVLAQTIEEGSAARVPIAREPLVSLRSRCCLLSSRNDRGAIGGIE